MSLLETIQTANPTPYFDLYEFDRGIRAYRNSRPDLLIGCTDDFFDGYREEFGTDHADDNAGTLQDEAFEVHLSDNNLKFIGPKEVGRDFVAPQINRLAAAVTVVCVAAVFFTIGLYAASLIVGAPQ
jgi:hypothetical protein